jgi:hypothetical protein
MNKVTFLVIAVLLALGATLFARGGPETRPAMVPVLVELFTSEGCSSCPPADALLQKLDTQPFPGAQLIVLSEHVDYWNHIGWTDPYSSHAYSERQDAYGRRFKLDSVYTPQMIVDGADEFLGSSSRDAERVLATAVRRPKIQIRITAARLEGDRLRAHVETDGASPGPKTADLFFVVALDHADSQVASGENAGRRLTHVAVVRSLSRAGTLDATHPFARDVSVKIDHRPDPASLRLIAFVQEPGSGHVLGATMEKLGK